MNNEAIEVWVYLKESAYPGLVRNKHIIAEKVAVDDQGFRCLLVIPKADDGPSLLVFPLDNIIYWTEKAITLDDDNG